MNKQKIIEKQEELKSIIHEVIWQYCYGKGSSDALFNYQDIGKATDEIIEQYFQGEAQQGEEVTNEDIEKYAKSFPGNTGNVILDMGVTAGFIEGAKAMRDGLIFSFGNKD